MDPDQIDLGTIYNVREREKTQYEYEQAFGPISVDISEEGLAANADAAGRMPQDKSGIRPNQSSTSEAVRAKGAAEEQATQQTPMAAEALAKILGFANAKDAREKLAAGKFSVGDAVTAADVPGNLLSAVQKATAEDSGLPPGLAAQIGTAGGLAAVLFPPGPGKAAGAMKAGKQAMEGTNPSRVLGMAEDVQVTIKNIGAFNAQRMTKGSVSHSETITKATGLPPVPKGHVRLFRGEGIPRDAEEAAEWAERARERAPFQGNWYSTDPATAGWYAKEAGERSHVKYVDVPADVSDAAKAEGGQGDYRVLPEEWSARARPVESGIMSMEEALKFDPTKYDLPTLRAAVAGHYAAAANYFTDVAKRVATGDTAAEAEYWTAYVVASDLAQKDALLGTQLGRGLEASKIALSEFRAPFAPQELTALAGQLAGAPEAGMDAATHARRMLMLTKSEQKTVMGKSLNLLKAGQNALYELWINALLSGPQTHAANVLSNGLTMAWAPGERFLSAMGSAAESAITGGDRTVFFGEAPEMLYGAVEGFKDLIRFRGKMLREGTAGGIQKVEIEPAITAANFGLRQEGYLGQAIDMIGAGVRTPGNALKVEDTIFKAGNFRMEARALAYREAAQEGLSGKQFSSRVKFILNNLDQFSEIKTRADKFAHMQTFNAEFGDLGRIGEMGAAVMKFRDASGIGRVVVPFVRAPTGLVHYASERTPVLNLFSDTLRADLAAGGERRALALGKLTGSAMIAAAIATYGTAYIDPDKPTAYMTQITGAGPKNPAARAALERLGWKPFAAWNPISSEYVQYNRLDPLAMSLGTVVSAVEIMGQIPEAGAAELAMASVLAISKSIVSKTYMEGLSSFLDAMEGDPADIGRFFQSIARSGVPAVVRQTSRTLDPIKRELDSLYDHWASGLPGYDGPPEHNIWGDEIVFSGGLGPDLVSPIYTSDYKPDEVDRYLMNNRIFLPRIPKAVAGKRPAALQMEPDDGKDGIALLPEERSRLGVLIGKGHDNVGPPLKERVAEIIAGPGTNGPGGSKADFIKNAVNQRIRQAVHQLRQEFPELDQAMGDKMNERMRLKTQEGGAALAPSLGR